jgi:tRNA threonylcarbamoyladenosine biosynthesis protein TsaE
MIVRNEDEMRVFGHSFAGKLSAGDWIAIDGQLGAGKTVLCAAIVKGLGFAGEVTSPSYAIVHHYEQPELSIAVAHADLYRLEDVGELDELGLLEESADRITLVEWAERAGPGYGRPTHHIMISVNSDGSRHLDMKTDRDDVAS